MEAERDVRMISSENSDRTNREREFRRMEDGLLSKVAGKRMITRAALLLTAIAMAGATGCRGSLYNDKLQIPFVPFGIDPMFLIVAIIVFGVLGPLVTIVALVPLFRFIFPPNYKVGISGLTIELWVSQRKFPSFAFPGGLVVPVAPDLKMIFGAAKIVRDWGGGKAQYEANKAAPLPPGEIFVGSGSRYRFYGKTILAVIFDEQKRTHPEWIASALKKAAAQMNDGHGASSLMIPDMTENLLSQPSWITEDQRRDTARVTARLMLDAIAACRGSHVKTVKIWVSDPANAEIFTEEMDAFVEEVEAGQRGIPAVAPLERSA